MFNHNPVWNPLLLTCTLSLFTPSMAHAAEPENSKTIEVPIHSVSLNMTGEQLQLWIEGDRLDGCDLPLQLMQQAEETKPGLTEIRIQAFHTVAADSKCQGEYVPFTIPFNVQQSIEAGSTYQIWVNDYNFTLENQETDG